MCSLWCLSSVARYPALWGSSAVSVWVHTVLSRCCSASPGEDPTTYSSLLLSTETWDISSFRLLCEGATVSILEHAVWCLSVHISIGDIARSVTAGSSDLQECLDPARALCKVAVLIHTAGGCCVPGCHLRLLNLIFLGFAFLGGWIVVTHFNLHFSGN